VLRRGIQWAAIVGQEGNGDHAEMLSRQRFAGKMPAFQGSGNPLITLPMKSRHTIELGTEVRLEDHNPDDTGDFDDGDDAPRKARARLEDLTDELQKLQGLLWADNRFALLIVLQGTDACGKDGTIRRVLSGLSPLGVHVTAFKAPNEEEREHDYLWRVHKVTPRRGEIAIFNRSHYEDVLVPRVHKLVPKTVWKARYDQINDFERMLTENGTVIVKFFLHISKAEQKERFEERLNNPKKYWKFNIGDIDERKRWDDYMRAYEALLTKCNSRWARWTIVPSDKKWYRDLVVGETIVETLKGLKMKWPPPAIDHSKVVID